MPRTRHKPGPVPQGGSSGLAIEAEKLRLTAIESLKTCQEREKERLESGQYEYRKSVDGNGKVTRILTKKQSPK